MSLFSHFSQISRRRKLDLFLELVKNKNADKILDVGGEIKNTSLLVELFPEEKNISVINISEEDIKTISSAYPQIDARVGDACNLPWPDNYFDMVYSNAVIEHVGDFERQRRMASEVMRVGKNWFVTTPNRWYPFEFHMRLPFVTWLPFHGYLQFGRVICYNHVKKKYIIGQKIEHLQLMTARELRRCFPSSRIIKQRVTFMAETLIAIGEKD